MKFNCSGLELAQAASTVGKMLAGKSNIPILDGINITAKGSEVMLSVFSQDVYIQKTIKADVYSEGEIVVEGKIFIDYTNKIHNKEIVEVEVISKEKISIRFGYSDFEMQYFEKENFPALGEFSKEIYFEIKEKELKELINRAIFCISENAATRITLRSCSFSVMDGSVEAVCLDGFRVAISKKQVESRKGNMNFILYGKYLQDLLKILSDTDQIISVSKEGGMIMFDFGHTKLKISTIDGEFYNYKTTLPVDVKNEITVKKDDITDCLERAIVVCRDAAYNKITITVEEKMMNLSTISEKGKINENIECVNKGEEIKFAVNCKFLLDAVSRIKEDYFKILIERPAKPLLIKPMDDEEYKCIVLPLKLIG